MAGRCVVLDATAVSALAGPPSRQGRLVLKCVAGALADGSDVLIPAAVLAECYRGGRYDQQTDAMLSRYKAFTIVSTTHELARLVGHILARAGRGSADHVDATVVATAILAGRAVIATGDPDDVGALAAGLKTVTVAAI